MSKLYDKNGKEYNVPHAVDVKEWLKTGDYTLENPKEKSKATEKHKSLLDSDKE